jgi:predicted anti-sigma-YlaC factor YlaD
MRAVLAAAAALLLTSCFIQKIAVNRLGDALSSSGTTFAADDDPELVRDALPFTLKLIESLLAENPNHRGLLLAASSGFTQYAYAFLQQDADRIENSDFDEAQRLRRRARNMFLRARNYGLRGLGAAGTAVANDPAAALRNTTRDDVPFLYWTAASWGAAIALSKDDPDLIADQPAVEALIDRALELDESFSNGSIHGFLITYELARVGAGEDRFDRSRKHFDRAVELTGGGLASPFVSYAENVAVAKQDLDLFRSNLQRALAIDPNARPEWRLENLVFQRRAEWLLSRTDELFLIDAPEPQSNLAPAISMQPVAAPSL